MTGPELTLLKSIAYWVIEHADADVSDRVARLLEAAHPGAEHSIRGDTLARIQRVRRAARRKGT